MGSDWFYLAREYVVPIIWVQTGFILPESMWCSDWFCLARWYVVPKIRVQTGFVLPESR